MAFGMKFEADAHVVQNGPKFNGAERSYFFFKVLVTFFWSSVQIRKNAKSDF